MMPEPMIELMKLKDAIGMVERVLLLRDAASSSSDTRWCRSLLDESGVSGTCCVKEKSARIDFDQGTFKV